MNRSADVFLHDRQTGKTARVNVTSDGIQANGDSYHAPSISADGRIVAFLSDATNLATGTTGYVKMVYVHERLVGPLAEPQVVDLPVNTMTPLTLKGRDPENDPLTFNIVTSPAHGALSGVAPDLVYEPNTDFLGVDRFTFTVTDGVETSAPAPVILRVPSSSNNNLCSKLGHYSDVTQRDKDAFSFKGIADEVITIKLKNNSDGVSEVDQAYVVLWQMKGGKLVHPRLIFKQGRLPIELNTVLPETGDYLIVIVERWDEPFIGDYCLSLTASDDITLDTWRATPSSAE